MAGLWCSTSAETSVVHLRGGDDLQGNFWEGLFSEIMFYHHKGKVGEVF